MQASNYESTSNSVIVPDKVGLLPLIEIQQALKRPVPESYLKKLGKNKGYSLFLPWYRTVSVLDKYAPGWQWQIVNVFYTEDKIHLVGRLTIIAADGVFCRDAIAEEKLKRFDDKTGEIIDIAYGDPVSNADSKCFRKAAAKFGLLLYNYEKDE